MNAIRSGVEQRGVWLLGALAVAALLVSGCPSQSNPPTPPGPEDGAKATAPETKSEAPETKVSPEEFQKKSREAALLADLAKVYLKHGHFQEAIESYHSAIAVTKGLSENANHHLGLSEAFRRLGKTEEAVENLKTAAEIYKKILPNAKEEARDFYYQQICLIHRDLGESEKAIEWAEKIAGDGKNPGSILKLARLYKFVGEGALASDTYNMVLKKLGDVPDALAVKLEFADFLVTAKNLPEARKLAEEVEAKAENKELKAAAKRLLIKIYDALGMLDRIEIGGGGTEEEKKKEEEKDSSEGE